MVDIDGDGQKDLIVGSYFYDYNGGDRGVVFIYCGVEGGFFEDEFW